MEEKDTISLYMEMTGQSTPYIFSGASQYGISFILDNLIPKALEEKKKIVWEITNEELDLMTYKFQDI